MTLPERGVVADLSEYLEYKRSNLPDKMASKSPRSAEMAGEMFPGPQASFPKILSVG